MTAASEAQGGMTVQEQMDSSEVKRAASGMKKAQLEQRFLESWRRLFAHLPAPAMQHRFHPHRKWRFDFSWPCYLLAVEIQGGSFVRGAHNLPIQQQKDYEKQRAAIRLGWRVLQYSTLDMKDPDFVVTEVAELLCNAKEVA